MRNYVFDLVLVKHTSPDTGVKYQAIQYSQIDSIEFNVRDKVEIIGYKGLDLGGKPRNAKEITPKNRDNSHYTGA